MSHDDGEKKGLQYSSPEPGSSRKSDDDLRNMIRAGDRRCPIGSTLRHVGTGKLYHVMAIVLRESDLEPLVMYRHERTSVMFARPLEEFLEKFEFVNRGW